MSEVIMSEVLHISDAVVNYSPLDGNIELQEFGNQDSFNAQDIDLFENNLITPVLLEACGIDVTPFYSGLDHQINLAFSKSLLLNENSLGDSSSSEKIGVFYGLDPQINPNSGNSVNAINNNIAGFAFKQHAGENQNKTADTTEITRTEARDSLKSNQNFRGLLGATVSGTGSRDDEEDDDQKKNRVTLDDGVSYVITKKLLEILRQMLAYLLDPNASVPLDRLCTDFFYLLQELHSQNQLGADFARIRTATTQLGRRRQNQNFLGLSLSNAPEDSAELIYMGNHEGLVVQSETRIERNKKSIEAAFNGASAITSLQNTLLTQPSIPLSVATPTLPDASFSGTSIESAPQRPRRSRNASQSQSPSQNPLGYAALANAQMQTNAQLAQIQAGLLAQQQAQAQQPQVQFQSAPQASSVHVGFELNNSNSNTQVTAIQAILTAQVDALTTSHTQATALSTNQIQNLQNQLAAINQPDGSFNAPAFLNVLSLLGGILGSAGLLSSVFTNLTDPNNPRARAQKASTLQAFGHAVGVQQFEQLVDALNTQFDQDQQNFFLNIFGRLRGRRRLPEPPRLSHQGIEAIQKRDETFSNTDVDLSGGSYQIGRDRGYNQSAQTYVDNARKEKIALPEPLNQGPPIRSYRQNKELAALESIFQYGSLIRQITKKQPLFGLAISALSLIAKKMVKNQLAKERREREADINSKLRAEQERQAAEDQRYAGRLAELNEQQVREAEMSPEQQAAVLKAVRRKMTLQEKEAEWQRKKKEEREERKRNPGAPGPSADFYDQ